MVLYLIAGGLALYCAKQKYDNHRLSKIIKVFQIYMDMSSKLVDMDCDSTTREKDFQEILPLCEAIDEQIEEIMKMPECRKFPAIYEFQNLAEVVRQEI